MADRREPAPAAEAAAEVASFGAAVLETAVLPLGAETARVETRRIETARVRVRTLVETETQLLTETLAHEVVEIERVPMERPVDAPPETRIEGDVTIVPVVEERLVVERRLVLVEELRIRRRRVEETAEIPVELRRTRAVVEREPAPGPAEAAASPAGAVSPGPAVE